MNPFWRSYFSKGLKPPTRIVLTCSIVPFCSTKGPKRFAVVWFCTAALLGNSANVWLCLFLKVPLMCFNGESWRSYESIDIFEAIQLLLNAIVQFVQLNHSISGYAQPYPKGFNADVKMCMKKEDCEVLVLNSIWKPPWTRHRWANILRHVELALTVDMVTTWYVVGCWKSHKTVCFWRKTVACITGHWLGIEKTVGVQSISQRSLSSCEYVIVYIFVCIVCCQFGGDFFAVCVVENSLAQGLPTYYCMVLSFGPKHSCVLVVTTSVYQTGAPTPRLKEDRNEISTICGWFSCLMLCFFCVHHKVLYCQKAGQECFVSERLSANSSSMNFLEPSHAPSLSPRSFAGTWNPDQRQG